MSAPEHLRAFFWDAPHRNGDSRTAKPDKVAWITLSVFILVNLVFVITHEPWQDEAQAWLLVGQLDLPSIFAQLKTEGHPALWYLVLFPFAQLGCPIIVMRFISLAAVSGAAWLLLWKSPFSRAAQILLLASPLFTYYLPVISRSYSVALLLLLAVAVLYHDRLSHPIGFGLISAALFQTHIILAGFALGTTVIMAIDAVQGKKGATPARRWVGVAIALAGLVATYLELAGGPDTGVTAGAIIAGFLADPLSTLGTYSSCYQFNVGVFETSPAFIGILLYALSVIAIIVPFLLHPGRCWRPLLLALTGIGAQIMVSVYFYSSGNYRSLFFWAVLITVCWIMLQTCDEAAAATAETTAKQQDASSPSIESRKAAIGRDVILVMIVGFFVLMAPKTWSDAANDINYPYSGCVDMGAYIEEDLAPGTLIVSGCGSSASSVIAFTSNMTFWNPGVNRYFTYCDWGTTWTEVQDWDRYMTLDDLIARYRTQFPDATSMYLLTNAYTRPSSAADVYLIHEESFALLDIERFQLYLIPLSH